MITASQIPALFPDGVSGALNWITSEYHNSYFYVPMVMSIPSFITTGKRARQCLNLQTHPASTAASAMIGKSFFPSREWS